MNEESVAVFRKPLNESQKANPAADYVIFRDRVLRSQLTSSLILLRGQPHLPSLRRSTHRP